jgi:hypothetical protein
MSENQVKNRFYSTLRRVATKKAHNNQAKIGKDYLIQFLEDAILYGHNCSSKRGRKPKNDKRTNEGKQNELHVQIAEDSKLEDPGNDVHVCEYVFEEDKHGTYRMDCSIDSYAGEYDEMEYKKLGSEDGHSSFLLVDPNHLRLLARQNEEVLEIIEEKSRYQINETQDLLEVLKGTKDKLKEIRRTIREIGGKYLL